MGPQRNQGSHFPPTGTHTLARTIAKQHNHKHQRGTQENTQTRKKTDARARICLSISCCISSRARTPRLRRVSRTCQDFPSNKMANSSVAVKAQRAAPLWRHNQYESNKKAQTEEETKACQHMHRARGKMNRVGLRPAGSICTAEQWCTNQLTWLTNEEEPPPPPHTAQPHPCNPARVPHQGGGRVGGTCSARTLDTP